MKEVQITAGMQMHRINDLWNATMNDKNPDEFFKQRIGRTYSSLEEELVTGLPLFDPKEQEELMQKAQAIASKSGVSFPDSKAFEAVSNADSKLGSDITSLGLMNFQHLMQAEFYDKVVPLWDASKKDEFKVSYLKAQDVDFMGVKAKCLETYTYGGASSYRPLFYVMMRHLTNVHGGENQRELHDKVRTALSGKRILELGSGPGFFLKFLKGLGATEVVGVDENEKLRDGSKRLGVNVVYGDARDLGSLIGNQQFDLVVSKDFLSYAVTKDDARPIMKGAYKLLSHRGISVHTIDYGKMSEEEYLDFVREHTQHLGGNVDHIVRNFQRMNEQQKDVMLRKNILNIGLGRLDELGYSPIAFLRLDCEDNLSITLGKNANQFRESK